MRRTAAPAPTGVERRFEPDEIIVTKTDLKGHITYANQVFLRVSAYTEAEVMGQPHSMIRHPDMPRGVFQLLWERLSERKELFAYACNLAGDGAHYWVFAHVTPSIRPDGIVVGYHSSRRVAPRRAIEEARGVYEQVRTEERRFHAAHDAAVAGKEKLDEVLAARGLSFDEWVWALAEEAVTQR